MEYIVDRLDLNALNTTDGKWDWQITVKRLTDGKQITEKISGGEPIVDACVSRLKSILKRGETQ